MSWELIFVLTILHYFLPVFIYKRTADVFTSNCVVLLVHFVQHFIYLGVKMNYASVFI